MKQSPLMSFVESCGNTLSGFLLSLLAQSLFLPAIGVTISLNQNLIFASFMTGISIARSFGWRRLMEALHVRAPLSPSLLAIAAERRRQIEVEGWTLEHDDDHEDGDLSYAASVYAEHAGALVERPDRWRWSYEYWNPMDRRRDLVRAGALIVAELDRAERKRQARLWFGRRFPERLEDAER